MNVELKELAGQDRRTKQVSSYAGARNDVLAFVPQSQTILDVGCNEGQLAKAVIERNPETQIWGIDINPSALRIAENVLVGAYCINLDQKEELESQLAGLSFDTIIAADVLEHTINPWQVFELLQTKLNPNGQFILSLPNIGHWETLLHILLQKFPRHSRGLYDDTHLRFFCRRNLSEFEIEGYQIKILQRNFRCLEKRGIFLDKVVKRTIGRIPWLREFFVFQWIIEVKKTG